MKTIWYINSQTSKLGETLELFTERLAEEYGRSWVNDWTPDDESWRGCNDYIDTVSYQAGSEEIFVKNVSQVRKLFNYFAERRYWEGVRNL